MHYPLLEVLLMRVFLYFDIADKESGYRFQVLAPTRRPSSQSLRTGCGGRGKPLSRATQRPMETICTRYALLGQQ